MHRAYRHRSPTLRSATRQICWHGEPDESHEDLIAALQYALVRSVAIGALQSDAEQDAALAVATGALAAVIEDSDEYADAVDQIVDALAVAVVG